MARLLAGGLAALVLFGALGLWLTRVGPGIVSPASQRSAAAPPADSSGRGPQEQEALARLVSSGLRAAEDEDAAGSDERGDLEALYVDYHPYFVRGDLDGDGRLDFAQAFVREGNGATWFDVAVFFGREEGAFSGPSFVEKGITLAAGDLTIERNLLVVTPDLSVEEAHRWRWDARARRFVDADANRPGSPAEDGDAPDGLPGERLRARV